MLSAATAPRDREARLVDLASPEPGPRVEAARGELVLPGVSRAAGATRLAPSAAAPRPDGGAGGFAPAAALACAVLLVVLGRRRLLPGGRVLVSSR